jgi:hypothetical protein
MPQRPEAQSANHLNSVLIAEGHKRRGHHVRHGPGQFAGVALGATHDPAAPEPGRNHVHDAHGYFNTSSS